MHFQKVSLMIVAAFLVACGSAPDLPTATGAPPTEIPSPTPRPSETLTPTPQLTPTQAPSPTLGIGSGRTSPVDGLEMLYIPAGPFLMGFAGGYPDEGPEHTVDLASYWIDKTEITNVAYGLCVQAGACKPPARKSSNGIDDYFGNPAYADFPVIFVSWTDANAYCAWAGGRLPTEAEWEKAARGTDGRMYPWGNTPPDATRANFGDNKWDVVAVGQYPAGASPYGVFDMAGNVWEWTADWYSPDYYSQSPASSPTGPETGTKRVLRGGSWNFDMPGLRTSYRLAKSPDFVYPDTGFRCVGPAE